MNIFSNLRALALVWLGYRSQEQRECDERDIIADYKVWFGASRTFLIDYLQVFQELRSRFNYLNALDDKNFDNRTPTERRLKQIRNLIYVLITSLPYELLSIVFTPLVALWCLILDTVYIGISFVAHLAYITGLYRNHETEHQPTRLILKLNDAVGFVFLPLSLAICVTLDLIDLIELAARKIAGLFYSQPKHDAAEEATAVPTAAEPAKTAATKESVNQPTTTSRHLGWQDKSNQQNIVSNADANEGAAATSGHITHSPQTSIAARKNSL